MKNKTWADSKNSLRFLRVLFVFFYFLIPISYSSPLAAFRDLTATLCLETFQTFVEKFTWHLDKNIAAEADGAKRHFNSSCMLSVFVLQRDPRRVLCPWVRITLSHTGGCSRRGTVAPLWIWLNGSTKWRETGRYGRQISPYQPGPRYSTIYRPGTHVSHITHCDLLFQ